MNKPKILVTSAAGRTGAVAVSELLRMGFPVRCSGIKLSLNFYR